MLVILLSFLYFRKHVFSKLLNIIFLLYKMRNRKPKQNENNSPSPPLGPPGPSKAQTVCNLKYLPTMKYKLYFYTLGRP